MIELLFATISLGIWMDTFEWESFVEGESVSIGGSMSRSTELFLESSDSSHSGLGIHQKPVSQPNRPSPEPTLRRYTPEEMCAGFGSTNPDAPGIVTGPSTGFLTGPAEEFCSNWSATEAEPVPDGQPPAPVRPSDELIIQIVTDNASQIVDPGTLVLAPNRAEVLVNKDVYLASSAGSYTDVIDVLGVPVTLQLTPTQYNWSLGDGTELSTSTPGGPWPNGDAVSPYTAPGSYTPSVNISWSVDIQIDGGDWQRLDQPARTMSFAQPVTVIEMESVLTRERK